MNIVKELNISLPGKYGKPVLTDVIYNATGKEKPVVIFVHGFKGFKDWGCWNLIGEQFAQEGYVFVKFNFSHNGTTPEKPTEFADLEAFGNNNFTKELDDLGTVIDWLQANGTLKKEMDLNSLFLIGHSRGGGISIVKAREDKRIKKLVSWASVAWLDRLFPEDMDEWEESGVYYTVNARTGQQMPLYYQLAEDYYENEERFDILDACIRIKIPFLIIHGTADEAVHVSQAILLKRYAGDAELILIENGTHTFGAKHPCEGNTLPAETAAVMEQTLEFLKK